jgi:hypothetical protein
MGPAFWWDSSVVLSAALSQHHTKDDLSTTAGIELLRTEEKTIGPFRLDCQDWTEGFRPTLTIEDVMGMFGIVANNSQ